MTYHLKPNRRKNRVPLIVVSGVVFVLVIIHLIFPQFFITVLSKVGIPIFQGQGFLGTAVTSITDDFSFKQNLANQNRDLQSQIDQLKIENERTSLLELENTELKKLLGRTATSSHTILATVLARPPQTPYDSLILDIGLEGHIAKGDRILAYDLVPIGRIEEVYNGFSKGVLYSTPGQSLEVLVGTTTHATAEALGSGSFRIKIPREVSVSEGDPIAIPSLKAELFGTVSRIDIVDGDAFKYLFFQSPVSLENVRWVQIETTK